MERRSTGSVNARKRYTDDAFEGVDELEDLRSGDEMRIDNAADSDDESEDRFEENGQSSEDDSSSEDAGGSSEVASNGDETMEPSALEDLVPVFDEVDELDERPKKRARGLASQGSSRRRPLPKVLHTRGVPDRTDGKDYRLYNFGASADDYRALDAAKRKWIRNATLPSRYVDEDGYGGMHESFYINHDASVKKSDSNWWAAGHGRKAFRDQQSLGILEDVSAADYMLEKQSKEVSLIAGPYNSPTYLRLASGQNLPLQDVWKRESEQDGPNVTISNYKRGFILNLGAKVQCVEWSPNHDGPCQYLAVSCLPERQDTHATFEALRAPAFNSRPPQKSSFQIWRFSVTSDGGMDVDVPPHLDAVLCMEWGDAKALKWCPMPYQDGSQANERHLGILAGIWSDGMLRLLDITLPENNQETHYLHVDRAALEVKPTDTICTCVTWITNTRIAAGCANGCVAVWDLPIALQSSSSKIRPSIYSNVSSTYILSITTCYPSHPYLLLTGSMAGFTSMTDLSRLGRNSTSQANTIFGNRARMGLPLLIWHDFGQIAIQAEDNTTIKASTLRRFFAAISLAKTKSNATSIASSPCHPSLLIGCANGDVVATNPLSRVVDASRSETWQQVWFSHEWRPSKVETSIVRQIGQSAELPANQADSACRLTEGFKAEFQSLGDGSKGVKHNRHQGTAFTTVYEEQSAITTLAWNPNIHVGGWAAAGMGSGLLRVEDISI